MREIFEYISELEKLFLEEKNLPIDNQSDIPYLACDKTSFLDEIIKYPIQYKTEISTAFSLIIKNEIMFPHYKSETNIDELLKELDKKIADWESNKIENRKLKEKDILGYKNNDFNCNSDKVLLDEKLVELIPHERSSIAYIIYYCYILYNIKEQYPNKSSYNFINNIEKISKGHKIAQITELLFDIIDNGIHHTSTFRTKFKKFKFLAKELIASGISLKELSLNDAKASMCYIFFAIQVFLKHYKKSEDSVESFYFYVIANGLYYQKKYNDVIQYAELGIDITDSYFRYDVFNILGFSSISVNGKKQLAYDTYFSWFNCEGYGELKGKFPSFIDDEMERSWRIENSNDVYLMHNNFAYVCAVIGDTYSMGSKGHNKYYNLALKEIEKADNSEYYYTYGTILCTLANNTDMESEYVNANEKYQKYLALPNRKIDERIDILENIVSNDLAILASKLERDIIEINSADFKIKEVLAKYKNTILFRKGLLPIWEEKEIAKYDDNWYDTYELPYKFINNKQKEIQHIGLSLLIINFLVNNICTSLKRVDYSNQDYYSYIENEITREKNVPIVFYTSLNNAIHLFDKLYKDSKACDIVAPKIAKTDHEVANSINCLTLMHAKYMNDPNEGLTFFKALQSKISSNGMQDDFIFSNKRPTKFRENLYDNEFIFLKAFTERIDTLDMWSLYGSDPSLKNDCDGCCVELDPATFEIVNENIEDDEKKLVLGDNNFYLYRVVYLSEDGDIHRDKNNHIPFNILSKVKTDYIKLKNLLCFVNNLLEKIVDSEKSEIIDRVNGYFCHAFKKCAFLFKDDSYYQERESRMLLSYKNTELKSIRELKTNPPKICINPYFQIYIKNIMLGPNIDNINAWVPYLQYKLKKMPSVPQAFSINRRESIISQSRIKYKK